MFNQVFETTQFYYGKLRARLVVILESAFNIFNT